MFPTCSEVLEVIKNLGYEKRPQPEPQESAPVEVALPVAPLPETAGCDSTAVVTA
jgi:hypothetical protein